MIDAEPCYLVLLAKAILMEVDDRLVSRDCFLSPKVFDEVTPEVLGFIFPACLII